MLVPYLKPGDTGNNVIKLQRLLNKKGYQVEENGIYGPDLLRAISGFQIEVGLDGDGMIGKATWGALEGRKVQQYHNSFGLQEPLMTIVEFDASKDQYYKELNKKEQIILKSSLSEGNNLFVKNKFLWENKISKSAYGSAFIIGGEDYSSFNKRICDGEIIKLFDEKYWSNFINSQSTNIEQLNRASISITVCNWGPLMISPDGYLANWLGEKVNEKNYYDLGREWRGFRYFYKYTNAQLDSLAVILKWLIQKWNIQTHSHYYAQPWWSEINRDVQSGKNGLWNEASFSLQSFGMHPQPELLQILSSL